jgi:hypothetical protein
MLKAFFCYFLAQSGKKVEGIRAKISISTVFRQDQTHQVRKIGSSKTLWMFSADPIYYTWVLMPKQN